MAAQLAAGRRVRNAYVARPFRNLEALERVHRAGRGALMPALVQAETQTQLDILTVSEQVRRALGPARANSLVTDCREYFLAKESVDVVIEDEISDEDDSEVSNQKALRLV